MHAGTAAGGLRIAQVDNFLIGWLVRLSASGRREQDAKRREAPHTDEPMTSWTAVLTNCEDVPATPTQ
jgi:hypothetical protein